MAEILLEPSSLSKIIPLSFDLNDTNASNAAQLMTKRQFNTADTDAWFEVNLEGSVDTSGSFDITLFNLNDKSVFNHTGKPFTTNPFYYKLDSESDETKNEIRHAGRWIGQIVVTLANGNSATRKFIFDIEGHILDGADVQTILLEDYNALIAMINTSKDLLTQYNVDYAALLVDLAAAETARTNTYNQLVADQQANIDAFDVALDTGIVAANLATKLQTFEATNNSRLLSAEQQLAETNILSAEAVSKADAMASGSPKEVYATLALLQSAFPTGTTGAYLVSADGNWYYWNGTAWTSGGVYQARIATEQISHLFVLNDSTVSTNINIAAINAIKSLKLFGFDKTKKHRLAYIARDSVTYKYRIIISQWTGSAWEYVLDTGGAFVVTENANGFTKVVYASYGKRIEMIVDYTTLCAVGFALTEQSTTSAKWVIDSTCFSDYSQIVPQKGVIAVKNGNTAKFKFKYNSYQNMIIEFGLLGINELAHMKGIYIENSNVLTDNFENLVTFSLIGTDWVSPYVMYATTNIVGNNYFTVGGNHGTTGSTGFATARRESVAFFAENIPMLDNKVYYCNRAIVKAVHYVAGSTAINLTDGTKRDTMKEEATYTITPNNVEVSVLLTAIEPLVIEHYAGLQASLQTWDAEGYFMMDNSALVYANLGSVGVNSALKSEANTDRFVVRNSAYNYLIGYMNRRVGLGDRANVLSTKPNISIIGDKIYIKNINGVNKSMAVGDTIYWNGGWTFTNKLVCPGAKTAYCISHLGKRVYCVDFLTSGKGVLEVLPEDCNKEIEIVEKSDSITCDSFVTKGLKVSATGYGQLKFTVK